MDGATCEEHRWRHHQVDYPKKSIHDISEKLNLVLKYSFDFYLLFFFFLLVCIYFLESVHGGGISRTMFKVTRAYSLISP